MAPSTPAATHAQIEALLNFMEEHKDLARGLLRDADGRIKTNRLWESLCNSLNAMGGCTKTVAQWQRVWADKKYSSKKAAAAGRRSASATGGGPSDAPILSEKDLKIMAIMGDGFGAPQTDARVAAFPTSSPVGQEPAAIPAVPPSQEQPLFQHSPVGQEPAAIPAVPPSQEQPSSVDPQQQTITSRRVRPRVPRVRRRVDTVRQQIIDAETTRNEELRGIRLVLTDLRDLIREFVSKQ